MVNASIESACLHVLIVDDNFAAAQTTGWLLDEMGYSYDLADGAATAMARAADKAPDVVLLDIGLPGLNGYDLCARMQALPAMSDTVFIAHTGYGGQDHRNRAAEVGCGYFLLKPCPPSQLVTILADIAEGRRSDGA